jgi:hypothetical protein
MQHKQKLNHHGWGWGKDRLSGILPAGPHSLLFSLSRFCSTLPSLPTCYLSGFSDFLLGTIFPSSLVPMYVAFCRWQNTWKNNVKKKGKIYFGSHSEVSVHGWLGLHCFGVCIASWRRHLVEYSCSPHGGQDAKRERRDRSPHIPFKSMPLII